MPSRKPIQVDNRTHEIIRRESFLQSLESTIDIGDISMGDVIARYAETLKIKRKFKDLPSS